MNACTCVRGGGQYIPYANASQARAAGGTPLSANRDMSLVSSASPCPRSPVSTITHILMHPSAQNSAPRYCKLIDRQVAGWRMIQWNLDVEGFF